MKHFVLISSYTKFSSLAHCPKGKQSSSSLTLYSFDDDDGNMVLLDSFNDDNNIAFMKYIKKYNKLYVVSEFIEKNGNILIYDIDWDNQTLNLLQKKDALGKSTCYITENKSLDKIILTNYWKSTISLGFLNNNGEIDELEQIYKSNNCNNKINSKNHINHSINNSLSIQERQNEDHYHAALFDPYINYILFIPDLGRDIIRQFIFKNNKLIPIETTLSGENSKDVYGPRYLVFHKNLGVLYVVNEISSSVSVFSCDEIILRDIKYNYENHNQIKNTKSLKLIQSISTIPNNFNQENNTCGKIQIDPSGKYLVVSNRGHNSVIIYEISHSKKGFLSNPKWYHTGGLTPRHFEFSLNGKWLFIANQDSNNLKIFHFNNGEIKLNNTYNINSPNFISFINR